MTPLDRLSKLTQLRDSGALSPDEFAIEKAKLGIGKPEVVEGSGRKRWRAIGSDLLGVALLLVVVLASALFYDGSKPSSGSTANLTVDDVEAADIAIRPRRIDEEGLSRGDRFEPNGKRAAAAFEHVASQAGHCEIAIGTETRIDGRCRIWREPDGFVQIAKERQGFGHFVQIIPVGNEFNAFWNSDPASANAYDALGPITEEGACWRNDVARICVRAR